MYFVVSTIYRPSLGNLSFPVWGFNSMLYCCVSDGQIVQTGIGGELINIRGAVLQNVWNNT